MECRGREAGGGLPAPWMDSERQRVAQNVGEGMAASGAMPGPNAAIMGQTMLAEGASQLGAFGSAAASRLDVDDFLAISSVRTAGGGGSCTDG